MPWLSEDVCSMQDSDNRLSFCEICLFMSFCLLKLELVLALTWPKSNVFVLTIFFAVLLPPLVCLTSPFTIMSLLWRGDAADFCVSTFPSHETGEQHESETLEPDGLFSLVLSHEPFWNRASFSVIPISFELTSGKTGDEIGTLSRLSVSTSDFSAVSNFDMSKLWFSFGETSISPVSSYTIFCESRPHVHVNSGAFLSSICYKNITLRII